MAWLKLIRWSNLLIIFLTQFFAWFCVIRPIEQLNGAISVLDFEHFILLSLSTVLIAAAGYIINDYFDIRIDNINHPEKMVLEKLIPRRKAIIIHTVMNVIAVLLAAYIARQSGHISLVFLQVTCTLLLWFYSTHFKRMFVTGNVVVSLLTALTIITLILYEPVLRSYILKPSFLAMPNSRSLPNPVWVLMVYAFFAFVLTWMREIVKDMEDFKGDEAEGCVTMPIVWGLLKAARFTQLLGIIALIPLVIVGINLLLQKDWLLGVYTFAALITPIIVWLQFLTKKATTEHYGKASRWLKIIMVSGVVSLIIYYIEAYV